MILQEKQILAKAIEIQKAVKYKSMCSVFSQIEALVSLKNAWLPPIFLLENQERLLSSAFSV